MSAPRFQAPCFVMPDLDLTAGLPGLRLTPSGRLATVTDAASIRQGLLILLSTRPGERVNRPTYGCHLFRLVFAPADDTTAGLAIHYVTRAVEQWEPRIEVVTVEAERPAESPWLLEVRMRYRIRATQREEEIAVAVPLDAGGAV